jgi:hypothetical protein
MAPASLLPGPFFLANQCQKEKAVQSSKPLVGAAPHGNSGLNGKLKIHHSGPFQRLWTALTDPYIRSTNCDFTPIYGSCKPFLQKSY